MKFPKLEHNRCDLCHKDKNVTYNCSDLFNFDYDSRLTNAEQNNLEDAVKDLKCVVDDDSKWSYLWTTHLNTYLSYQSRIIVTDLSRDLVDAIANEDVKVSLNTTFVKQNCVPVEDDDYTIVSVINIEDDNVGSAPVPNDNCASEVTINGRDVCMRCSSNYWLDLSDYSCVEECSDDSIEISTTNSYMNNNAVRYCRPKNDDTVTFYVSQEDNYRFEAGTKDYPFSNLAFAFMEVFNF